MVKSAGNCYPYLLVDEGLKKNHSSDRLRKYLCGKIAKRAEMELSYIRQLQDWLDDLRPLIDGTSNCYLDTEVTRRLMGAFRLEAQSALDARQHVYNQIMAEQGPYAALQRLDADEAAHALTKIDEEFSEMFKKRKEMEREYNRHKDMVEHTNNKIETIEAKVSNRSHVITTRRPSTRAGTRKVDELIEQLSALRKQNETESERAGLSRDQLVDKDKEYCQTLMEMDSQLQELEADRIRAVVNCVNVFLKHATEALHRGMVTKGDSRLPNLDSVLGLLDVHWCDVRTNARRAERGEDVKYTEMFSVDPLRRKQASQHSNLRKADSRPESVQKGAISKGLGSEGNREIDRRTFCRPAINLTSDELESTHSILSHLSSRLSSSGSSVETEVATAQSASRGAFGSSRQIVAMATKSKDSIESLDLPPETRCVANITKIDPYRQYRTRMKLAGSQEPEPVPTAQITEYSQMRRFDADVENSESGCDVTSDSAMANVFDVKVVAIQDNYPAPGSNELPFKAGQTFRQKRGVDETGMCYGWTRENRMSRKIYGYYRPSLVKAMK
ncbi:uncharacterized protein LOC128230930 [Mya arenaria]|uniref:uncharacterized protein LOC128230930 n=1 Tax=Mya arenaria TaxID=6604 RepID=UPI0022E82BB7|nr:uncharacterized protein LOC128230930 [Mya arenaria]